MNKQPSVDDWFKKQFEGFAPDAPDVWGSVQQGIQAGKAASSAASVVAKSSVKIAIKWIVGAIAVATVTTAVIYNTLQQNNMEQKVALPLETNQIMDSVSEIEQVEPSTPNIKETAPEFTTNGTSKQVESATEPQLSHNESSISHYQLSKSVVPVENEPVGAVSSPYTGEYKKPNTAEQELANTEEVEADRIEVNTEEVAYHLKPLPTIFTPNGDGLNDEWVIEWEGVQFSFIILDTDGNKVYESKQNQESWNGVNGYTFEPCAKGNYIFVIRYQRKGSDNQEQKTGIVKINY